MPGQRTFTLIPEPPTARIGGGGNDPSALQSPIRPMTSKQVRKAYKQASKAPRMSRAEAARAERAEQERIRKEFEKEKSAARARAAREKKREKEMAERESKRRSGMPLVSVRPSQDTIARFVRGNGSGRKRDPSGERVVEALVPEEPVEEDKPAEEVEPAVKNNKNRAANESQNTDSGLDIIVEEDELEMLAEFDDIEAKTSPAKKETIAKVQDSVPLPALEPNIHKRQKKATVYKNDLGLACARTEDQTPQKEASAEPPAVQNQHPRSPTPPRQPPPLSTQAIFSNFDAFFPSASQLARELEEEYPVIAPQPPPVPPPAAAEPEEPPKPPSQEQQQSDQEAGRFFTSSGNHEIMALVKHRSRRTAAREQWQRRTPVEVAPRAVSAHKPAKPGNRVSTPHGKPVRSSPSANVASTKGRRDAMAEAEDKENARPQLAAPIASQETEYGGDWVDDLEVDFWV